MTCLSWPEDRDDHDDEHDDHLDPNDHPDPDDHLDRNDHLDHHDNCICKEVGVAHKQGGGYLIPYNLQPSCVKKLEAIWPYAHIALLVDQTVSHSLSPLDM